MIYNIQTFCTYGYWPDTDLKPHSEKPIIAACDICGKVRITTKNNYHGLCMSCSHRKQYEDKPRSDKENKAISDRQIERFKDPLERKKMSDIKLKQYKDNPISDEVKENMRDGQIERFKDPLERENMAEIINNSVAHKIASENMRGGNDIVNHHYIYDHNDLSLYTMKITRSRHRRLHIMMRREGIKVPHINNIRG